MNPFVRCLDLFWIFFKRWNHGLHRKGWLPQQEAPYHPNFSEILGHRKICLLRCRWRDPQAVAIPAGHLLISVSTSQLFHIYKFDLLVRWLVKYKTSSSTKLVVNIYDSRKNKQSPKENNHKSCAHIH